ncbi:MAG: AHH domain-containing protein [Spirosomataceae bacterium]
MVRIILFSRSTWIFDLDLGVDFFKYRVSDPVIGRFWSPDPLSSQFPYNSVYAFQENKLGLGIELEGAELISFPLSSTSAIARPFTIPNTSALRVPILPNGTTLAPMSSTQKHHLNPQQHKNHEIVKEARKEGFKQDGKENKIPLEKYNKETGDGQHGNHPKYNEYTKKELDNFAEKNPARQPQESLEFVRNMVKDLKAKISENPKAKINDLFNSNFPVVSPDNTKTNSKPNPLNVNPCLNNPNCL